MSTVNENQKLQYCDLILLENCNLQCKMCYMWQCKNDVRQVPVTYYERFITSLYEFCGSDIKLQFVGGEPLLKPGILDVITSAARKGFFTSLTSNGFCITRKMAHALIATHISSIALSLDSMHPEIHDFLRGKKGVHKQVMKALRHLSEYKYHEQSICIVVVMSAANLNDIIPMVEWAQANDNIACISFQSIAQPFYTVDDDEWYTRKSFSFLWPNDTAKVDAVLDQLIERKQKKYKIGNAVGQLMHFKRYFKEPKTCIQKGGCHLGYNSLSVNSAGDMYICFDQPPIGNIMRDTIAAAWNSAKTERVREKIKRCKKNCKLMMNCFSEEGFSIE